MSEIKILIQLKGKRIVHYIDATMDSKNNIYIHMEFCSDNLTNVLKDKSKFFSKNNSEKMEYYICCQIFIEMLEAVKYLHEYRDQNGPKPIMHRDLKPANILFDCKGTQNGIFFKLCDFGFAKFYEDKSHSRFVGTTWYMAPEVRDSRHYDTKSDIYSLGKIGSEIFGIDIAR